MKKIIFVFISLLFANVSIADSFVVNDEWNRVLESQSIKGVFILCKGGSNSCTTNNIVRAKTEYIPASTFKIAHSLIGLETGVIRDEFQVFKWDGQPKALKQWEQDLTLRGAIQVSAVPVFQRIARNIGERKMKMYLRKLSYGNANIEGGIDKFWLDGKLRISAINQISLVEKLSHNALPFSDRSQYIVKEALISEATPDYVVHSKTGFSGVGTKENPGIGWWVGWVEKGTEIYYFAFNMDIDREGMLPFRKTIPKKLMESAGLVIEG
jgi:beta-lactamase class D OXA-10